MKGVVSFGLGGQYFAPSYGSLDTSHKCSLHITSDLLVPRASDLSQLFHLSTFLQHLTCALLSFLENALHKGGDASLGRLGLEIQIWKRTVDGKG